MKLALETVREPFNLANGPVLRARLIRLAAEDCLLCMPVHHVVSDGFTGSILLDELGAIYDAFAAGEPNPLPEAGIAFHRLRCLGAAVDAGRAPRAAKWKYWRAVLQGAPSSLELPTDLGRSSEPDRRGRLRSVMIPRELLERLQALAQVERDDAVHGPGGGAAHSALSLVGPGRFSAGHGLQQPQPQRHRTHDWLFREPVAAA